MYVDIGTDEKQKIIESYKKIQRNGDVKRTFLTKKNTIITCVKNKGLQVRVNMQHPLFKEDNIRNTTELRFKLNNLRTTAQFERLLEFEHVILEYAVIKYKKYLENEEKRYQ